MFILPKTTIVDRFIPKNFFDKFINTKQKNEISEKIKRIIWENRLSTDTINLSGNPIQEIQIFSIELKIKAKINDILSIIDKAIPYPIIFLVSFNDELYVSTSAKHNHVSNENQSVIDYTFTSEWINKNDFSFNIELKISLDWVYKNFCHQLSNCKQEIKSIVELVNFNKENDKTNREIERLEIEIKKSKQFNKKVELNMKLTRLINKNQQ